MQHDDHCHGHHQHHHHHAHHSHSSSDSTGMFGCIFFLFIVGVAIWLVQIAVSLALLMIPLAIAPIWTRMKDWNRTVKWVLTVMVLVIWLAAMPFALQMLNDAMTPKGDDAASSPSPTVTVQYTNIPEPAKAPTATPPVPETSLSMKNPRCNDLCSAGFCIAVYFLLFLRMVASGLAACFIKAEGLMPTMFLNCLEKW